MCILSIVLSIFALLDLVVAVSALAMCNPTQRLPVVSVTLKTSPGKCAIEFPFRHAKQVNIPVPTPFVKKSLFHFVAVDIDFFEDSIFFNQLNPISFVPCTALTGLEISNRFIIVGDNGIYPLLINPHISPALGTFTFSDIKSVSLITILSPRF